ncbi:MAG TPA: hypothetical protein PLL78_13520 [Fimbriimonadaceae bacterium]|nr:hypothetical protein [Fimbriimonadaceae bacterium]HRJ97696.1 hypothetical protein [Fimbriimonadaceae bacterium]
MSERADSQPQAHALVTLQPTTPGTPQVGHTNISGTSIADQFLGGGAGLLNLNATNISSGTLADARLSTRVAFLNTIQTFTAAKTFSASPIFSNATVPFTVSSTGKVNNLNADLIDGLDSSAFITTASIPLALTGDSLTHILAVTNTSVGANAKGIFATVSSNSGRAVHGVAGSGGGTTYGVFGEAASTDGRGVFGLATSASGPSYGGRFESTSTSGRGVAGIATAPSGATIGVLGSVSSTTGTAILGQASASTGLNYAGFFDSATTSNGASTLRVQSTATTGEVRGIYATTASASGTAVWGRTTHSSGFTFAGFFETVSPNGIGVFATGGSLGVTGHGSSVGVDGVASGTSGSTYGGHFQNNSTSGAAVLGTSGLAIGVHGASSATNRAGVLAENTAASGSTIGIHGRVTSTSGLAGLFESPGTDAVRINNTGSGRGLRVDSPSDTGIWVTTNTGFAALDGRNAGTSGIGVFGNATATSGSAYGVRGTSASTTGRGVYGQATASSGINYGVLGEASSDTGIGVYGTSEYVGVLGNGGYAGGRFSAGQDAVQGFATATSGLSTGGYFVTDSTSGRSVQGSNFESSGPTYGIYGVTAFANPDAWSIWAQGDLGASGFKGFRIDHPEDPANMYLQHYAAESPEVLNIYSGKVTLDGKGEATVEMPSYFARINRDPRYTLTPIGAAMPNLHIVEEISETALAAASRMSPGQPAPIVVFRVAGGVPGKRVSWEVKAVRNDRYSQERPARVEVDKIGIEAGRYLHPELYGRPESQGMAFRKSGK